MEPFSLCCEWLLRTRLFPLLKLVPLGLFCRVSEFSIGFARRRYSRPQARGEIDERHGG